MDNFPPLTEELYNLWKSAKRLAKHKGAKLVPREIYEQRGKKCESCDKLKGNRCLICGCNMPLKRWLSSESCGLKLPKWRKFEAEKENLPLLSKKEISFRENRCKKCYKFQDKSCYNWEMDEISYASIQCSLDLWKDIEDTFCIIISARNEIHLSKTIEGFLENTLGNFEIYIIIDGWDNEISTKYSEELLKKFDEQILWIKQKQKEDDRIKVIVHEKVTGIRCSFNEAARKTNATFIAKFDSHVKPCYGWNYILAQNCDETSVVTLLVYGLDTDIWEKQKNIIAKFCYLQRDLKPEYCYDYHKERIEINPGVFENMTSFGSSWLIRKDYWWKLGGYDESLAVWGQSGVELSLKAHLYGGRFLLDTRAWEAHAFNKKTFPYRINDNKIKKMYRVMWDYWHEERWPLQQHSLYWLAEKFSASSWNNQFILTEEEKTIIKEYKKGFNITQLDWEVLGKFIHDKCIKSVVEFGSGLSTILLEGRNLDRFVSCETRKNIIIATKEDLKKDANIRFTLWSGKEVAHFGLWYDMAFIDGPRGGENREFAYKSVAESEIPYVACHDSNRQAEKKWISKYLSNWKVIEKHTKFTGLVILQRPWEERLPV